MIRAKKITIVTYVEITCERGDTVIPQLTRMTIVRLQSGK